jgi:hypothetical protein
MDSSPFQFERINAMSQPTLDERVSALEQEVARLSSLHLGERQPPERDWRSTLGMFAGDAIMKEIIEEGRKIRERDREQTRR